LRGTQRSQKKTTVKNEFRARHRITYKFWSNTTPTLALPLKGRGIFLPRIGILLSPQGEGWDGGGFRRFSFCYRFLVFKSLFSVISVADIVYSSGTISSATMLMILINGLTAGPAVSL